MNSNYDKFLESLPLAAHIDRSKQEDDLEAKLRALLNIPEDKTEPAADEVKQAKLIYNDGTEYSGSIKTVSSERHGYGKLEKKQGFTHFEYQG